MRIILIHLLLFIGFDRIESLFLFIIEIYDIKSMHDWNLLFSSFLR